MKKYLPLLFCLSGIGATFLSAQVPGYQGKRFSVGYNASTFFYVADFGLSYGVGQVFANTRLTYKTELHLNYVLSRKVSAGFSYYFAKQKLNFRLARMENFSQNYNYRPETGKAPCKIFIYEFNLKFFRKNFVAPAGLYNQFSAGIVKYSLGTSDNTLTVYDDLSGATPLVIEGDEDAYTCYKFGYAIGKTNPIGHKFYLTTAFGVNIFSGGDGARLKRHESLTMDNYIRANFNRSLRTQNTLEVKLGFGWLAF